MEKIACTVEILTWNSEKTLKKCLESVKDFDDIIILDGNSTDKTLEIAQRYGARIIKQIETDEKNVRIEHFGEVRNKGLKHAKHDWFLYVDSDEYLSDEVVKEIGSIVAKADNNKYFAYNIPRLSVFKGRILDKLRPVYQVRFFNLKAVEGFIKRVHERINIKQGYEVGVLKNPEYVPLEDIESLKKKWDWYIDLQMQDTKKVSLKLLLTKTWANLYKFTAYWVKYVLSLVRRSGSSMPFLYEYYNALYHLKIIWRYFKIFIKINT